MLTKRQKEVLDFVKNYSDKKGYAPSLEEICKHFKLASVSTAHFHIKRLRDKGLLIKEENQPRALSLTKEVSTIEIPLLGAIAAGQPIETIETPGETITISRNDISSPFKHYALRVEGDSMIEEGIFSGDIVVIREQHTADNGQTVVAIIDDNKATLKKLYREKNRVRLQPANQSLLPIFRTEVEIRGIVEKIIRTLDEKTSQTKLDSVVDSLSAKPKTDHKSIFLENGYELDKIYNTDCLDLLKNIKNESLDLIFADPPYNLSHSNFKMKFVKSGGADLNTNKGKWDKYSDEEFEEFTKKWLSESFRVLKKNGSIWVAGTYHNIYLTGYLMKKIGFEILNEVLWHKSDATPNLSCTRFVADHENFIWARKGKGNIFNYDLMKKANGGKQMRSLWTRGKTAGGKKIHPTQKPEWLLERVILSTSTPQSIVFDPFIGSGTTAAIAKKFKRRFLGSELDSDFFKKAVQRINNTQICGNIS
jgi:site-specific DNA-methyltransferase (adenine-specific)